MNTAVLALAVLVVGVGLGVIIAALVWTVRGRRR
jgi:hypothetical protein